MENKKLIGSRIKEIRKFLRLTQKEFAETLDISGGYISDIEKGKKNPGRDVLEKLFDRFHANISYLFDGKGEYFAKPEKDKAWNLESEKKDIGEGVKIVEEMKWAMDNIPVVRFALIEFYLSYLFEKQEMLMDEVDKYREKNKKEKNKI